MLSHLSLTNFRCFENFELNLPKQLLIIGANGQGKSSILEAIRLLTLTRSHRTKNESELIKANEPTASVVALVAPRKEIRLVINRTERGAQKQVNFGGQIISLSELVGTVKSVLFTAEELDLLTGAPRLRRGLLDGLLLQRDGKKYAELLVTFHRSLKQRNSLLASKLSLNEIQRAIGVWDLLFTESAAAIMEQRQKLTQDLAAALIGSVEKIKLLSKIQIKYHSTLPDLDRIDELLVARLERDHQLGTTTLGPHRDDVEFSLNNRPMTSASRGEQRSALIALKLAEYELLGNSPPLKKGDSGGFNNNLPIFLFDDVFAELDPIRRAQIATELADKRCIITTADERVIPNSLSTLAKIEL